MKINIDAGHGSNTAGKRTPAFPASVDINQDGKIDIKKGEQYREHYANVGVASLLVEELKRCGFDVMRTGFDDENASNDPDTALTDRQKSIEKAKCDYSISIHFNAFGDGESFNSAQGVEIYIHDKYAAQSEKLAKVVLKHLSGGTKQSNRGVSAKSLAMCNCKSLNVKAAIIVELAFMTNEKEALSMMANQAYWKESAQEIAKGVCEYAGVIYIAESYIPKQSITTKSSKQDILWAQERLNAVTPSWLPKLTLDGIYGPKMRIAVLIYWEQLGWGRDMTDHGTVIGTATKNALATGRKE